ncbi:LacI family DNA-binding transcriptional regulator [Undibacterium arcticum]|uniref:LacI family DNA-binding transcriptional regulator n=1 Tax=Undibacterium arcticum TaxID=1762892 RepID=A0ABV7F4E3_9BURK
MPATTELRRLTIRDVAREAGVSLTTVSHSLNDRGYVDPATRAKVKRIAEQLGYRPNLRAQRLRTGRANCIALFSSMPFAVAGGTSRLGFMMEIAAIAAEAALAKGLALMLVPSLESSRELLDGLDIDGALVIEPVADDPQILRLKERGVSIVCIGRQLSTTTPLPYVDLQPALTGRLLLEHLYAQGARRISLLIGAQSRYSYLEVERVYQEFVRDKNLPCFISKADESGGEESGRLTCMQLMADHPEIDAICVPVDAFATGALRALRALEKRVPDDVMLVTRYDGLRARNSEPPMTAVNLHLEEVASLAVELLFEHICADRRRDVVMGPTPQIIARKSTMR